MLNALAARLKAPPIVEVVCGFFFPPIPGLDSMAVGQYWAEKKRDVYPTKQLHPPVVDRPGFVSFSDGVGPLRSWLVSDPDEYVLQIQPDRFYFNWRKRKGEYPHFNDYEGTEGVLTRTLREFEEFGRFCEKELGHTTRTTGLDLAKIDLLTRPTHWKDYADLARVLPMLKDLPQITEEPTLHLSLVGRRGEFQVHFGITNAVLASDMSPGVQIETRVTAGPSPDTRLTLSSMNELANNVFFGTLDKSELHRFGGLIE